MLRNAQILEAELGLEFEAFISRMRNWNPTSYDAFIL
jgi:hypothetical protein